jgi:hypothetical protein
VFGLITTWTVFAGLASKPVATVSSGLASKPAATVSSGLSSKLAAAVSGGLASKPAVTVLSSLASKLVAAVSPGLASKPTVGFSVEPRNQGGGEFLGLGLKIIATLSWFVPQNQVGFGLSVVTQNRRREVDVGYASRSSGLLHMKATLARVSQFDLKTSGGATMGGARDIITEVASEAT